MNPGLWNSEYSSRNPDIKFYWQRFRILGTGVVSRIQDSLGIPFHGAKKTVYMQEENSLPAWSLEISFGIACLGYLVIPM